MMTCVSTFPDMYMRVWINEELVIQKMKIPAQSLVSSLWIHLCLICCPFSFHRFSPYLSTYALLPILGSCLPFCSRSSILLPLLAVQFIGCVSNDVFAVFILTTFFPPLYVSLSLSLSYFSSSAFHQYHALRNKERSHDVQ